MKQKYSTGSKRFPSYFFYIRIYKNAPLRMCTAAYNVVVTPLGICPENKKDSNKSEGSSYNI